MTEFGFIDQIIQMCNSLPTNGCEGIGDDCAVIPIGGGEVLLFTQDMLIERVHFLREATSAYDLGRKSLAVNLSDVAAMGATPVATLLSLSIPKELMGEWIEAFMSGYRDMSEEYGVALIGGDTTASKGDLAINVTAIGRVTQERIKRRRDARVGDIVVVTGELGGSGRGLEDILRGEYNTTSALVHKLPTPRVMEGQFLSKYSGVHAMMDISDGVASDLKHILKASSVGAEIDLNSIPAYFVVEPSEGDLQRALCSGEDYELLFTVAADEFYSISESYREQFGQPLYPIGKIVAGDRIMWMRDGILQCGDFSGFSHY